jgi:hypothetical protein
VRYDYIKSLLAEVNKSASSNRVAVVKNEFDFEVWVNSDWQRVDRRSELPIGQRDQRAPHDARRDPRAQGREGREAADWDVLDPAARQAGCVNIDVTRGWTEMDATVRGKKFHFVNTHLEAFDNSPNGNPTNTNETVGNGEIREAQAKELIVGGGAASSRLPVDPARRPELRHEDRGQEGRRPGVPSAARHEVRGAQHLQAAWLLA